MGIYGADGSVIWQTTVESVYVGGTVGATISVNTNVLDCDDDSTAPNVEQAWAKATDVRSGLVSNSVQVVVGCNVL